ncbi:MAG: hypothetical protein RL701_1719 [Pseudomonadota bacterium]|jgi:hypothetical protein
MVLLWRRQHMPEDPKLHAERLSTEHGVTIGYGHPSNFYTAPYGPQDAEAPGYEPHQADPTAVAYALEGVESALQQYPHGFVSKLIRAVFICGELRMGGARAGGTAGRLWIVLAAASDRDSDAIRWAGYIGLHHELSSFAFRYSPTTKVGWLALEPADAAFAYEAGAAIARADDPDPDPATGFLSVYGASNPENDFNTYAEMMFAEPKKLARLAEQHELVRRKLSVVRAAYVAIDPAMDAGFKQLGI